jgi:outer membrane protein OmpA-like peptidoglycan-associated protein
VGVTPTRARRVAVAALVAALVAGAAGGCGGGDDEQVDSGAPEQQPRASTTQVPTKDSGDDGSTHLGSTKDDRTSDLAKQVSETLSDLSAEAVEGDTVITLPDEVLFDFNRSELRSDAAATLDRIAQAITYFQDAPVHVAGHTDSRGSDGDNQQLSEHRAQSVVDYLVGAGVDRGRLTAQGFGESEPVAPNENADGSDNPEGRAQNRRVEIVIQGVDPADVGQR